MQVSISDASTAQFSAPRPWPASRAFFLLCQDWHNRKNFLFAGADAGGEILADAMTVIETAKLSGCNPEAYLADILARIRDHDPARIDELLPWNWKHRGVGAAKAA